ncbi:23S rRNA (pseudouridine(1915)-N(3))-methyltransferase RlmH [Eubacteriaceae bacterium ES3]|nr:23S rRNA (pseudouridine(1915)-N(3))-methyltransferase RlmH [Eubacteriaceae bacterium ES3]
MYVQIICLGKIKEKFMKQAIDEYSKRLSSYCRLEIIELKDEIIPEKASDADYLQLINKEGERILGKIKNGAYVICLDLSGQQLDSQEFSRKIENLGIQGKSHIIFIIGGSLGLSESIKNRADLKLSFSKMTFPHQLFRVMLLEQIYRSFKIIHNETYHK